DALDALFKLQTNKADTDELVLPEYDHALLWREMMLFEDWFLGKHLGQSLSEKETQQLHTVFEFLAQSALSQTQVWVHRDYHSRNLMAVNADNPGVLDFQDAVNGPITYDLVSLLRDCYVAWPLERVEAWVAKYYDLLISQDELKIPEYDIFLRWFDLMGVQRHLKAIGIFSRLNYRDGKPGYLADIPRTLNYVQWVCEKYPELSFLKTIVMEKIVPVLDPESGRVVQGI
ncbi:MAG: phosphotransferase, partial [Gammaproteobacteria bacterium]|nr:phosphotransferase [Gammaproteobacteria bacterium]